jgi:hypothetical protein
MRYNTHSVRTWSKEETARVKFSIGTSMNVIFRKAFGPLFLSKFYRGIFLHRQSSRSMKLNTQLHLLPMSCLKIWCFGMGII